MGFFLNSAEPMSRMRVVVPRDRAVETLVVLQRAGVLHAEQSDELRPVDRDSIEREMRQVNELRATIDEVLHYVPGDRLVAVEREVEVFLTRPLAEIAGETRALCTRLGAMHRHLRKNREKREALEERRRVAAGLASRRDLTTADFDFSGTHLFSRLIAVRKDAFHAAGEQLEGLSLAREIVEIGEEAYLFLIAETVSRAALEAWVKAHGARFLAAPGKRLSLEAFVAQAGTEAARLDAEAATLQAEIEGETEENLERLVLLREALVSGKERLQVLEKACQAKYVTLFEGWVPDAVVEAVSGDLREEIGFVHIECLPARPDEEPPSKLRNVKALRPFEVVVNLFGRPKYREWDPTPIVAYSFAFFFGVMLGDAVYGALLILLTRFVLPKFVDDPQTEEFALFRSLLYISAGSAIVVGVLTGTYLGDFFPRFFGAPNLALAPVLQGVYLDTMTFIMVSLVVGLIHVNIGHLLMFIRGIKERKRHLVIGRLGFFILQIAGIPWILNFIGTEIVPLPAAAYTILLYIILVSFVLIIISSIMEKGAFLGGIFWIFDITGILGDVMSYARLAGVGLATYFLAYCFNMMSTLIADMLPEGLLSLLFGPLIIFFILFFGHVLNLFLSSITCFVHSLRLCFVEFLFKFYEGGGSPYRPFRLRNREFMPVKAKP